MTPMPLPSVVIRDATEIDAAAIAALHAESWRSAYRGVLSEEYLEKEVHRDRLAVWQERFSMNPHKLMFVMAAELESVLTGFVCVFPEEDAVFGSFLDNLHVTPKYTGQGIGRRLLSESAKRLVTRGSSVGLYLWVIEQNYRARQFYEKAGAEVVGSAVNTMPDNRRVVALRCYWPDPKVLVP
jgi:ribosomal protein S18 acetylase RimI-like enzyme